MEDEMQELRELVVQLRTDNDRLRRERELSGSNAVPVAAVTTPGPSQPAEVDLVAPERFVFVPRDRRCPKFCGKSGIGIEEWVEEAEACMRVRCLSKADRAFFLFDHLEGEAREEIRHRPSGERGDPDKIIMILRELYGCSQSYVALQEAFFSRKQQDGESLLEFSLVLMSLLERVKQQSANAIPNSDIVLRDQFVEYVADSALRRELKQLVRRQPAITLLEVRGEAIRWEREGMPGGARGRSQSVPMAYGIQYGVQGHSHSELRELREMLQLQQQQLDRLTRSVADMRFPQRARRPSRAEVLLCHRCQKPGHVARECDGERVRSPSLARRESPSSTRVGPTFVQPSEN
ncbi:uncharacterized protein Hap1MRO34_016753 [Clarias gariepinus]|uniref:uncharacterized protein LOC128541514 n=1 Tax=Clarias gariepinus TaxID=13013 RepID=UPI00234D412B|nr:uncharacterized protein LOC128541514 [Clarias gariepinus]